MITPFEAGSCKTWTGLESGLWTGLDYGLDSGLDWTRGSMGAATLAIDYFEKYWCYGCKYLGHLGAV